MKERITGNRYRPYYRNNHSDTRADNTTGREILSTITYKPLQRQPLW